MSISHSLFLFRKVLPAGGERDVLCKQYVARMSASSKASDPSLLAFIAKEIKKIFPKGWDKSYRRRAGSFLLPTSATIEGTRISGGGRASNKSLPLLRRFAISGQGLVPDNRACVSAVRDGCKWRIITKGPVQQAALKPLHDTLYDFLSTKSWLLRGDADPKRFQHFHLKKGDLFVSGDYESATDNIHLDVVQTMVRAIQSVSPNIPPEVFDLAYARTECFLYSDKGNVAGVQRRGQLMGNFLSFPLLCLLNYIMFRRSFPGNDTVLINGDDIVFRCKGGEEKEWFRSVGDCGLVISAPKTMVDPEFFTLNSTLFRGGWSGANLVPFIRPRALFTQPSSPSAFAGQFRALCPGFSGVRRHRWWLYFLRHAPQMIHLSQRSLTRGMGLKLPVPILRQAGLLRRELFYLSLPSEQPLPAVEPGYARVPQLKGIRLMGRRDSAMTKREWRNYVASHRPGLAMRLYGQLPVVGSSRRAMREALHKGTMAFVDTPKKIRRIYEKSWKHVGSRVINQITYRHCSEAKELVFWEEEEPGGREGLGFRASPIWADSYL